MVADWRDEYGEALNSTQNWPGMVLSVLGKPTTEAVPRTPAVPIRQSVRRDYEEGNRFAS
jgi:hypothetical protein